MSNPLGPAEMAAVRVLTEWEVVEASDGTPSIRQKEERTTENQARALVDAIRPIIAAEALDDMADRFEAYGPLSGEQAWPFVADIRMATTSLRAAER